MVYQKRIIDKDVRAHAKLAPDVMQRKANWPSFNRNNNAQEVGSCEAEGRKS